MFFFLVKKISMMNHLWCNCYTYQTFQLLHLRLIKVNTSQYWQDEFSYLLSFISIKKCGSKIVGSTITGQKILSEKKFRLVFEILISFKLYLVYYCHKGIVKSFVSLLCDGNRVKEGNLVFL